MAGVNKVILVGNLGKDPEVRHLDNGAVVATFSLATSESYKDKNGNRIDQTEWHNIVAWRGLAEISEKFLHKGSKIYVEGKIRSRSYDDKEGIKRYVTEIVVDNLTMLDSKQDNQGNTAIPSGMPSANLPAQNNSTSPVFTSPKPSEQEDDLPF